MNPNVLNGLKNWKSLVGAVLVAMGQAVAAYNDGAYAVVGQIISLIGAGLTGGTVATTVAKAEAPKAKK